AYVALDPAAVKAAKGKKLIDAAFGITIEPTFYDDLFAYVDHQKARQELFGK
ncbi:YlxR family protein, partial [Lacticaseibacillus paracasei]